MSIGYVLLRVLLGNVCGTCRMGRKGNVLSLSIGPWVSEWRGRKENVERLIHV